MPRPLCCGQDRTCTVRVRCRPVHQAGGSTFMIPSRSARMKPDARREIHETKAWAIPSSNGFESARLLSYPC
jgi:hypothetical protein